MTPNQFSKLIAAGAVQNLQISSRDGGRLKFMVSRGGGPATLYFRLDAGKFTRVGGCDSQALEVDQLLIGLLQAGNADK